MLLLPEGFEHHTLDTGEVTIGYSTGPDNGPPLLLLHGVTSRRDGFVRILEPLMARYQVFTMDQRGHGYSGHTPGHYGRDEHARDIRCVLDQVCGESTVVWGHSMGGGNAAETAFQNGAGIRALVLEDPGLFGTTRPNAARRNPIRSVFNTQLELVEAGLSADQIAPRLMALNPGQPAFFGPWKAECLLQMDIELLRNAAAGAGRSGGDPRESLSTIDCPMLLVQADPQSGGILPDDYLETIVAPREDLTVRKLPGTGHNLNREHPDALLEVTLPWLEALR